MITNTKGFKESKVKISHWQLMCMLALSLMFMITVELPGFTDYSMGRFISILLCWVVLVLLYIPFIIFSSKTSDGILTVVNKPFKWIFGIVIITRVLYVAFLATIRMKLFVSNAVMPFMTPSIFVVVLFLGVLYGSVKGIQAVSRISPIIITFYVVFIIAVSILMGKYIDTIHLYSPFNDSGILSATITNIVNNDQIFLFAVLSGFVRERETKGDKDNNDNKSKKPKSLAYKSLIYYIPVMIVIDLWLNFLYHTIFGRSLSSVIYPLHSLSAFSQFSLVQRMDGTYFIVALISGVLKVTLLFICMRIILFELFGATPNEDTKNARLEKPAINPRTIAAKYVSAGLVIIFAIVVYLTIESDKEVIVLLKSNVVKIYFGVGLVFTCVVMPIVGLIFLKRKKKKDNEQAKILETAEMGGA